MATFHTATERSRALSAFGGMLRPLMEKVTARIAVSPLARRVQVEHLGGDAVEIPNGVDVAALRRTGRCCPATRGRRTVGFLGRFDEPRKGMPVLLDALRRLAPTRPGPAAAGGRAGRRGRRCAGPPARSPTGWTCSAPVDEATKAAALRSVRRLLRARTSAARASAWCSPRRWRPARRCWPATSTRSARCSATAAGVLFPTGDADALAGALAALLDDPARRAGARRGRARRGRPRSTGRWSPPRCCGSTVPRWPPTRGGSQGARR